MSTQGTRGQFDPRLCLKILDIGRKQIQDTYLLRLITKIDVELRGFIAPELKFLDSILDILDGLSVLNTVFDTAVAIGILLFPSFIVLLVYVEIT